MRRVLLWILILVGIGSSVPAIRERAAPRLEPVFEYLTGEVGPVLGRAFTPVKRWLALREMRSLALELRRLSLTYQALPEPRHFPEFLERSRFLYRGSLDPWGTPYRLTLTRDSIIVSSSGPDMERDTEDDLRQAVARR